MPVRADAAQTRLMVRIARMYHELGKRQTEMAAELHVSQPRVSRLLKRAVEKGIVRTVVTAPEGTHLDLEEGMEERFGLAECIVVDSGRAEAEIDAALSSAAATRVVQLFGGAGHTGVQVKATRLIDLPARATGAEPVFFPSPAVLGSAGGERKRAAVRGVLRGGWVNVLITDVHTARDLLGEA